MFLDHPLNGKLTYEMAYWGEYEKEKETQNYDFIEKIVKSASLEPNDPLQPPPLKKFKHAEPK